MFAVDVNGWLRAFRRDRFGWDVQVLPGAGLHSPSALATGYQNGGRQLRHVGVVRTLVRIGDLQDLAHGPAKFSLTAPDDSSPGKERVVVFAQRAGQGPIVGAVLENLTPGANLATR